MKHQKKPCTECGKMTSARDGVCASCMDTYGGAAGDKASGTPIVPYWDDDTDDNSKKRRIVRASEEYHGDVYRDDI